MSECKIEFAIVSKGFNGGYQLQGALSSSGAVEDAVFQGAPSYWTTFAELIEAMRESFDEGGLTGSRF